MNFPPLTTPRRSLVGEFCAGKQNIVSEHLFDSKTPTAVHYILVVQDEFRTQAYTSLNCYGRDKQPSAGTVANEFAVEREKQIKTVGFTR